jgi:hypothetical protein
VIESSTWGLLRHRMVTDHAFKVGAQLVVLFLDADSEDAAAEIVNGMLVVQKGLWVFDIDPVSASRTFERRIEGQVGTVRATFQLQR